MHSLKKLIPCIFPVSAPDNKSTMPASLLFTGIHHSSFEKMHYNVFSYEKIPDLILKNIAVSKSEISIFKGPISSTLRPVRRKNPVQERWCHHVIRQNREGISAWTGICPKKLVDKVGHRHLCRHTQLSGFNRRWNGRFHLGCTGST